MIAEPGTLVHLPAGTIHWFGYSQDGGEMITMTSREAASLFFADVDRVISPEAPDVPRAALVEGSVKKLTKRSQGEIRDNQGRYGCRQGIRRRLTG
jgi:hypothetical protein